MIASERLTGCNTVKTGKYRLGDEYRAGVEPPDEVCESFSEWVDDFLKASIIG